MHKQQPDDRVTDFYQDCCDRILSRRQFLTRAAALTVAGSSALIMAESLLLRNAEGQTGIANSTPCILFNMTGHDVVMGSSAGNWKGGPWETVLNAGTSIPKGGREIGKMRSPLDKDPEGRGTTDHYGWLYFVEKHNGQETAYQLFLRLTPREGQAGVLQARLGRFNRDSNSQNPMPSGTRGLVQVVNKKDGPVRFFLGDFGQHRSQTYWP